MAGAAASKILDSARFGSEAGVSKYVPNTTEEDRQKWRGQSKDEKLANLRSRTDGIVGGDKADDETLNRLHDALSGMGH